MTRSFFCPHCWKEIKEQSVICPYCEWNIQEYANLSYEEKLINALNHPVRENRMMAIRVLGELRSKPAIPFFAALLETEKDFYVIREIIHALCHMGSEESRSIIRRLQTHRSRLVRKTAREALHELS